MIVSPQPVMVPPVPTATSRSMADPLELDLGEPSLPPVSAARGASSQAPGAGFDEGADPFGELELPSPRSVSPPSAAAPVSERGAHVGRVLHG